ncbi:MAG: hypothetical protein O2904_04995 [bacterium]|nr:hypothetical protein [bacterium]
MLTDISDPRLRSYYHFLGVCAGVLHSHDTASFHERQSYHGTTHSLQGVSMAARTVFKIIIQHWPDLDSVEVWEITHMVAAAHDWYQEFDTEVSGRTSRLTRVRNRGPNEESTAQDAKSLLYDLSGLHDASYTALEYDAVYQGICNTYPEPDFGPPPKWNTMIQPGLHVSLALMQQQGPAYVHPASIALPMGGLGSHRSRRAGCVSWW